MAQDARDLIPTDAYVAGKCQESHPGKRAARFTCHGAWLGLMPMSWGAVRDVHPREAEGRGPGFSDQRLQAPLLQTSGHQPSGPPGPPLGDRRPNAPPPPPLTPTHVCGEGCLRGRAVAVTFLRAEVPQEQRTVVPDLRLTRQQNRVGPWFLLTKPDRVSKAVSKHRFSFHFVMLYSILFHIEIKSAAY